VILTSPGGCVFHAIWKEGKKRGAPTEPQAASPPAPSGILKEKKKEGEKKRRGTGFDLGLSSSRLWKFHQIRTGFMRREERRKKKKRIARHHFL